MSDNSYVKQKASRWTPFVFIILLLVTPYTHANNCIINQPHENIQVAHVYDGDTLRLTDGRKIRLIGINTPEHGHNGNPDEPFYQQAKNKLEKIVERNTASLKLILGSDKRDRHSRYLAHLFTAKNENINALLIRKGLGFTIAIPPNVRLLKCYLNAEAEARKHQRGIWGHHYSRAINVTKLSKTARGFHQVSGTIKRVGESRSSYWLNLNTKSEAKFALRILKKNLNYFTQFHPKNLLNKHIVARGWIYIIKGEQRITIHHPASIQTLNAD